MHFEALNVTRVLVRDDRLENARLRLRGTAQGTVPG